MPDLEKLNKVIASSDYPVKVIARKAGMSVQTLHNKRKGKREFTVSELIGLSKALNLTQKERNEIFLMSK